MREPLDVPDLVRQRVRSLGALGDAWTRSLPDRLHALAARWQLVVGPVLSGGTAALVTAATLADGRAAVVKLFVPDEDLSTDSFDRSVIAHRLAAGRGCVELFDHDSSTQALLLERLGPNLAELEMGTAAILETVCETLCRFWRPVTQGCGLPTGADKAEWLAGFIVRCWDDLGAPCDRVVLDRALEYCSRRAVAFDPSTAVLVHADAHGWNTLAAGNGTYKFVDPEGLCSDRANDLAVPMREYNEPLVAGDTARLVHERAEWLASRCDADVDAVWEWGFIERVSTGLANLRDFDDGSGATFLEVARRCC